MLSSKNETWWRFTQQGRECRKLTKEKIAATKKILSRAEISEAYTLQTASSSAGQFTLQVNKLCILFQNKTSTRLGRQCSLPSSTYLEQCRRYRTYFLPSCFRLIQAHKCWKHSTCGKKYKEKESILLALLSAVKVVKTLPVFVIAALRLLWDVDPNHMPLCHFISFLPLQRQFSSPAPPQHISFISPRKQRKSSCYREESALLHSSKTSFWLVRNFKSPIHFSMQLSRLQSVDIQLLLKWTTKRFQKMP